MIIALLLPVFPISAEETASSTETETAQLEETTTNEETEDLSESEETVEKGPEETAEEQIQDQNENTEAETNTNEETETDVPQENSGEEANLLMQEEDLIQSQEQTVDNDGEEGESGEMGATTINENETEGDTVGEGGDGEQTGEGEEGGDGGPQTDGTIGENGEEEAGDGEDAPVIPVGSENAIEDDGGSDGSLDAEGENGTEGDEGESGSDGSNEETGGLTDIGTVGAAVDTGDASASGEIKTDANNNLITSEVTATTSEGDLDTHTLNATGTNEALVDNTGTTSASTGDNVASSTEGLATVDTGDAFSALNIANIINTNVINSTGFINLVNMLVEAGKSLDLREFFFPDPDQTLADGETCSFISCYAEDIIYNIQHLNLAEINNDALLEAITGSNIGSGETAVINTGDAYGGANLMNVANTNIIDSNYLLLALNAMGSLDGNLILPSEDLFKAFFGKPNALQQAVALEGSEIVDINADNLNNATTTNNINTIAETGLNQSTTTNDAIIKTGFGFAESNIVNEINKNLFGGDSMYFMIRIHGEWSGNVYGLPEGLTWERVPEGVLIYNEGAEITPSQIVTIDVDSYTANINNQNDLVINNNIDINSLTGDNAIIAEDGTITTGNAYAGANVMNIGNTNVIGRNWMMATLNIFGDLNGDISFGAADLWVGGEVESSETPVRQGTKLTYTYTIKNNGDLRASGVELVQELSSAYTYYTENGAETRGTIRREALDSIAPGETVVVTYEAYVDDSIPNGTTPVIAVATLSSDEPDNNETDNTETLTLMAERISNSSGGNGNGGGKSSGGGGGRDKDDSPSSIVNKVLGAKLSREKKEFDPTAPPTLEIIKTSNFADNSSVNAGTVVRYSISITNYGSTAYDVFVMDTLVNPIGSIMNRQSWNVGDIPAGEGVELTYEIAYNENTPSGEYVNTVRMIAYERDNTPASIFFVKPASHRLQINGTDMAIGNVKVVGVFPNGNGMSSAIISWETTKPADGQIFISKKLAQSPYNPLALNYGYERVSSYYSHKSTKHYMFIPNLINGTEYNYRIRSSNGSFTAMGGDYTLSAPGLTAAPLATVKAVKPKPTPQSSVAAVKAKPISAAPPKPESPQTTFVFADKNLVPEPSRIKAEISSSGAGSFVKDVAQKVFGLFSF